VGHAVDGAALHADPDGREVDGAALVAPAAHEGELVALGAVRRRRRRGIGVGPAGRLPGEEAPPGEERGVAQAVVPGGDLGRHRRRRAALGQGGGGAEQQHGGAVGQDDDGDGLAGLGPVEGVGQQHARLGGAGGAPPLQELVGGGGDGDQLGQNRPIGVAPEQEGGGGVAPVALVAAAGQAGADVGQHGQGRHPGVGGGEEGADAGPHGPAGVDGQRRGGQVEGGVNDGGVG